MKRKKAEAELDPSICDALKSPFVAFANSILKDKEAVAAAISLPWASWARPLFT